MKAAGMAWLALNVGDGQHWDDWQVVRDRARVAGVEVLPWARVRTLGECHDLLETADLFANRCLLNIENEFADVLTPSLVASLLPQYTLQSRALDVGISTVAWLYNSVDYTPLGGYPFLLQLFPEDNRWTVPEIEQRQRDCVLHAREKGITYVGVTFQTYDGVKDAPDLPADPSWYAYHEGTRSYYTGDDIGGGQWRPWAI